jgi:hypothetical protein
MADIYGKPGQGGNGAANAWSSGIFLRIALPLVFLFILASAGLHAFQHGHFVLSACFASFFVFLLLRFDELGLTLSLRMAPGESQTRAGQIVAMTLEQLPDGFHVFHDVRVGDSQIDHAVVGPNGFFLITTKTHPGKVTESRQSLRLGGWPFLQDLIGQCWRRSQALMRHLELENSGAIQVCPVLCFSRAGVETSRIVRGVMIAEASTLARMIEEHESPLSSEKVMQLTDRLGPLVREPAGESVIRHRAPLADLDREEERFRPAPACAKCRHIPSALEAELFPGECPRCGRLHSAVKTDSPAATGSAGLLPSAASIAAVVLTVAAGAGILSYQAGLIDPWDGQAPKIQAAAASISPSPLQSPAPAPFLPAAEEIKAAVAASPGQEPNQGTNTVQAVTNATPLQPSDPSGPAAVPLAADDALPQTIQEPSPQAGKVNPSPACDPPAAEARKPAPQATPEAPDRPVLPPSQGRLTVVTAKPATLWLTNDETMKRFGPYETRSRKEFDIVLPKGCYSVVLLENGRRRQTTVSFLSDTGRLEF